MARNIKASPPWQGSQAGLYWHPRDSAGQGERGPGGGGCRSPLAAAGARGGSRRRFAGGRERTSFVPRAPR